MDEKKQIDYKLPQVEHPASAVASDLQISDQIQTANTGSSAQQSPLPVIDDQTSGLVSVPTVAPDDNGVNELGIPEMADDIDLIEKEWVQKAKKIVQNTLGDPYRQKNELSNIKAEYIKKRYNRDIQVGE